MSSIVKKIKKADIVSFDIFDTALFRKVEKPTDVFTILELKSAIKNFSYMRRKAESDARSLKNSTEITLTDIYDCIDIDNAKEVMQQEIELEKTLIYRNEEVFKLYKQALELGKKVVFSSDMYLDINTVKELLHVNGYTTYNKLYLSSELGCTKRSGKLFERLISESDVASGKILHIGDYIVSDVVIPRFKGIKVYHYKQASNPRNIKISSKHSELEKIAVSVHNGLIKKQLHISDDSCDNFYYNYGYKYFGVLLLSFCKWIHHRAVADKAEHIFFLARDGFLVQKVYELLYGADTHSYLLASRRAYNFPGIKEINDDTVAQILNAQKRSKYELTARFRYSVRHHLQKAGLKADNFIEDIKQAGFESGDSIVNPDEYSKISGLIYRLSESVLTSAENDREALFRYFENEGLLNKKKIAIVDLGWHGSSQSTLSGLLSTTNPSCNLLGYYLGLFDVVDREEKDSSGIYMAYLFKNKIPRKMYKNILNGVPIVELICANPSDCSLINFKTHDGGINPIFDNNIPGKGTIDAITQIQRGVLTYVEDMLMISQNLNFTANIAAAQLGKTLSYPTKSEAKKIGVLETDNFGIIKPIMQMEPGIKSVLTSYWLPGAFRIAPFGSVLLFIYNKILLDLYLRLNIRL